MEIAITGQELLAKNAVDIQSTRKLSGTDFWHFTTAEKANAILNSKTFWAFSIAHGNDKNEKKLHGEEASAKAHILCFCNTRTDSIPMWYLYSGLKGSGMSIGFSDKVMLELIRQIKCVRAYPSEDNTNSYDTLNIGEQVELHFGWVYYRRISAPDRIHYRSKWYHIVDGISKDDSNYFVKDYPWFYEKEFRIVLLNKTEKNYEKLELDIPDDIYKSIKLRAAPEMTDEELYSILKGEGFMKYSHANVIRSMLGIKMGLFEKAYEEIIADIKNGCFDEEKKRMLFETAGIEMKSIFCGNER